MAFPSRMQCENVNCFLLELGFLTEGTVVSAYAHCKHYYLILKRWQSSIGDYNGAGIESQQCFNETKEKTAVMKTAENDHTNTMDSYFPLSLYNLSWYFVCITIKDIFALSNVLIECSFSQCLCFAIRVLGAWQCAFIKVMKKNRNIRARREEGNRLYRWTTFAFKYK